MTPNGGAGSHITQLNSVIRQYHSNEQCTKPSMFLQMQSTAPVGYDPKHKNQSPRRETRIVCVHRKGYHTITATGKPIEKKQKTKFQGCVVT